MIYTAYATAKGKGIGIEPFYAVVFKHVVDYAADNHCQHTTSKHLEEVFEQSIPNMAKYFAFGWRRKQ